MKLRWALLAKVSFYYYFTLQRNKLRQKGHVMDPSPQGLPQWGGTWGRTVSSLMSYPVFYSYNYFQPQKSSVQHCRSPWALGSGCRFHHYATCLKHHLCLPVMFQKLTKSSIFLMAVAIESNQRNKSINKSVECKTYEFRCLVIEHLFIYFFLLVCLFEALSYSESQFYVFPLF